MFSSDEFKNFADHVVLLLHNTSYLDDEPYPNLLREKGGNGYPTVSFLDATGRVLRQQPAKNLSVETLEQTFDQLTEWRALQEKAATGDKAAAKAAFLREMEFGMLTSEEGRKKLAAVEKELTPAQRKSVAAALVNLEFQGHLRTIVVGDETSLRRAGAAFAAMVEAGRIPKSDQITTFWQGALAYAEAKGDADQFEMILVRAKKEMAGDPRAERYVRSVEKRLERLRKRR